MVFFNSWQLWEQLTFVLGMGLVAVFIAGYVKLWWITRRVRKHELDDEEKQMRVQEMQANGQVLAANPEEISIPFGVRAIEKGVQVPGIWISRESTPLPEGLRISTYKKRKSDASETSLSMKGGRRAFGGFGLSNSGSDIADAESQSGTSAESSSRRAYKPTRSSQLRFTSYQDRKYDPDTLGKLEGNIAINDGVQVRRPRGAGPIPGTAESSSSVSLAEHADNERSSGSSESSDRNFARNAPIDSASASQSPSSYLSAPAQQHGGYFSVPARILPANPMENPFVTPEHSPSPSEYVPTPAAYDTTAESFAGESGLPLLQPNSRTVSPERSEGMFEPGFQHVNRATRHVNPGFSVLPAGTFNQSSGSKGKEVERPSTGDSQNSGVSEKRKSNKLQKKARFSMTGPRRSSDLK